MLSVTCEHAASAVMSTRDRRRRAVEQEGIQVNILIVNTTAITRLAPAVPRRVALNAAVLREAGYEVDVLDLCFSKNIRGAVETACREARVDVIIAAVDRYEALCQDRPDMARLKTVFERIRAVHTGPLVICGSCMAEAPVDMIRLCNADFGIVGETEAVLPEVVGRLASGGDWRQLSPLPGVLWRELLDACDPGVWNVQLNELPLPAMEGFAPEYGGWTPPRVAIEPLRTWGVETRRGCPYDCPNCRVPQLHGPIIRTRSMDGIIDEIDKMIADHQVREWFLLDRHFQFPYRHITELCHSLSGRAQFASWTAFTCNGLESVDLDMLHEMKAAGCDAIVATIPSLHDDIIASMGKTYTVEHVVRFSGYVKRAGMRLMLVATVGYPEESIRMLEDTLTILEDIAPPHLVLEIGLTLSRGSLMDKELAQIALGGEDPLEPARFVSTNFEPKQLARLMGRFSRKHEDWWFRSAFGEPWLDSTIAAVRRLHAKS
ncbi:radical SAM protein [bacterium]|nr:radical SAM protein [candidate division CSSED10-310 bacterium]